jgi:hypothetical protein
MLLCIFLAGFYGIGTLAASSMSRRRDDVTWYPFPESNQWWNDLYGVNVRLISASAEIAEYLWKRGRYNEAMEVSA